MSFVPSGQVKPAQVGRGVVVTVVQGGGSLWQQIAWLHLPTAQTTSLRVLNPSGHVNEAQVGAGVVVTVVMGVVVMMALQQVFAQQWPVTHTTSAPIKCVPSGQVYPSQVGSGVVVTVVILVQHFSLQQCLPHKMSPLFK